MRYAGGVGDRRIRRPGFAIQIGVLFGIPIRIHLTFLLLLVWFGFDQHGAGANPILAIIFLLLVFSCVVAHELGHALMAKRYGVRTREIVLYPIGGIARLEGIPGGEAELLIALAGPAVNFVLAIVLAILLVITELSFMPSALLTSIDQLPGQLLLVNVALFLFNLVPAFPMDGGRVLRAALALAIPPSQATRIATTIGQGFAVLIGLTGLVFFHFVLVLIGIFIFVGASQEAAFSRQHRIVEGRQVQEAMVTRYTSLAPQDPLERALNLTLTSWQQDFPVLDGWSRVVGVLTHERLIQGLQERGGRAAVLEMMDRDAPVLSTGAELSRALELLRNKPGYPILVVDDERLVGMLTVDGAARFLELAQRIETTRGFSRGRDTD
jgi:Zn-dependent protease/predicted transcriptional regulator